MFVTEAVFLSEQITEYLFGALLELSGKVTTWLNFLAI